MKFTFYGGAGEIGGNKILLDTGKAKAYLDFGEGFDFGEDYFYEYLQPRGVNGLEVLFEFDLIPRVRKLYNSEVLRFTDIRYEKPDIDAVFITHHHSDHVGHICFLDEDIPIHLGHGTMKLLESYRTVYPTFCDNGVHNNLNLFKSGDKIEVKDLVFNPVHVEHSAPGAYGYIIDSDEGNVVFTGDFRRHGPMKEFTEEFIEKAAKTKPRVMLCEGTRMTPDPEKQYSEEQVYEKVKGIINDAKGLVFAEFAMSNIDRFKSFFAATKENGRIFVMDPKMAYILDSLREKIKGIPDPRTDQDVKVYYRMSKTCTFCESDYRYKYEKEFFKNKITYREIKEKPKDYVMHINFNKLMELIYLRPEKADYIYSSSEHFLEGEENKEKRTVMENWLTHFKIPLHKAHCSGHASKSDIEYAVKKIKPEILIPMHTTSPEEFTRFHDNVIVPEKGGTIDI